MNNKSSNDNYRNNSLDKSLKQHQKVGVTFSKVRFSIDNEDIDGVE